MGSPVTVTVAPALAIATRAEPVGSLSEIREAGLDGDDLLTAYRNMVLTRGIEERGHILYRQGKIPGSFYTGRGNEGSSVGVATAMGADDVGTPLHRDMGVHVVRGVEPWRILAQFMGRADGPTRGKDGNVHMADARLGLIAMVSHLPAMLPVAVGCALAFRIREERRVAVGWFGEGAAARGDTHEAMNFAGVRRLEGHAVHDDAFYVPKDMFEEWAKRDPLERFRGWLRENAKLSDEEENEITAEVKRLVNEAVRRAEESPLPDASEVLEGVYATP